METLEDALKSRRLLLDGAMGSMIQTFELSAQGFDGNNDALVLLRPDIIGSIHRQYLEAGADIITTCTFSSQRISQAEYGMEGRIVELNRAAARIARQEADRMNALTPGQPRFVLGDVGPTNRMLSMSDDVSDPAARSISFDGLEGAYMEQIEALTEGGADGILLETVFDTLNAKAGISAYCKVCEKLGRRIPLLISMTISDKSGRTLSGQTVEAFVTSVMHAGPLCIGMNCGLGAGEMLPWLRRMKAAIGGRAWMSCHPNAGLPNQFGKYDQSPAEMATQMRPMVDEDLCRIIGGCCGTTPAHIKAMAGLIRAASNAATSDSAASEPGAGKHSEPGAGKGKRLTLSGLEAFQFGRGSFVTVGERCNVAGSRKFLRLIGARQYDEALDIARAQIGRGAMVLDVNMDDGLLDAGAEMRSFLNLVAADPSISRLPVMVDSSRFEVIEEGLKCCQGKCVVNSISLKQGEQEFLRQARIVRRYGAAVIVMCFDEQGQATDFERRIQIAQRAYRLLTQEVGFPASDIIFDPNVLTIATGMAEHANYALDFIRATEWITRNLPGARVSGGLSNLSFAFRGNNQLREAMHSVFLHHAVKAGMGMAIMNPGTAVSYESIDPELREALTAVILNTREDATETLTALASRMMAGKAGGAGTLEKSGGTTKSSAGPGNSGASGTSPAAGPCGNGLHDAGSGVIRALVSGVSANLESDLLSLLAEGRTALEIISGPLMTGMNEVGRLFGEGQMFLPQVVSTARTMKKAVEILDPYIKGAESSSVSTAGTVVLATVKGDVHDIGKNIVGVVLACNGFKVIDLGVMVPAGRIVAEAVASKADIVCLSGLITPSLDEMCHVAQAMQEAGLSIPLFVGGATTSPEHTAIRIAPLYKGGVFHMRDAARNPVVAMQLLDPSRRSVLLEKNAAGQEAIRREQDRKARILSGKSAAIPETAADLKYSCDWNAYVPAALPFEGRGRIVSYQVQELIPHIDWGFFYHAWKVRPGSGEAAAIRAEAEAVLERMAGTQELQVATQYAFYKARGCEGSIEFSTGHGADCPCCKGRISIETPRQALLREDGSRRDRCLSLSDFVNPDGEYVGAFACTVQDRAEGQDGDILRQTIKDRLVEAGACLMEIELRKLGWGGIRPAVGYPSVPDQRQIFRLAQLLDLDELGITLTENGAMIPQSSVCGLLISHPDAVYFNL